MNSEMYGWAITIILFALVALLLTVTWILSQENGYDKGYTEGYFMGAKQISFSQINKREKQLKQDNEYLMGRVVQLFDQEQK
jgi:hypothetical protein